MKKYGMIWTGMVLLGFVLGFAGLAQAKDFRALLLEEKAAFGATHVATIDYADFAGVTTTNMAGTNIWTNAVAPNSTVQGVWYDLPQPFAYGYSGAAATNGMTNAILYAGVPSAVSNLLGATEMGAATTPIYARWGQGPNAGISFLGVATTNIMAVLTGNPYGALSQLTNGQARIYVRILTRSTQLD